MKSLQYRLKAACAEVAAFKSGKKYMDMQEKHEKTVRSLEHRIKDLEKELAESRRDIPEFREYRLSLPMHEHARYDAPKRRRKSI